MVRKARVMAKTRNETRIKTEAIVTKGDNTSTARLPEVSRQGRLGAAEGHVVTRHTED